jgi:hypothetical protein
VRGSFKRRKSAPFDTMNHTVKLLKDSTSCHGTRVATYLLTIPHFLYGHFANFRDLSVNLPIDLCNPKTADEVVFNMVLANKYEPRFFGSEGDTNNLKLWDEARTKACDSAHAMFEAGAMYQQWVQLLYPFMMVNCVCTATDYGNLFNCEFYSDTPSEMIPIVAEMRELYEDNAGQSMLKNKGEWHVPFVDADEQSLFAIDTQRQLSVARCARGTDLWQGKKNIERDLMEFNAIMRPRIPNLAYLEHTCTSARSPQGGMGNLVGWLQMRNTMEVRSHSE